MFIEHIAHSRGYYYFKSGEYKYLFSNNDKYNKLFCNKNKIIPLNGLDLSTYGNVKLISFSEFHLVFVNESDNIYIISNDRNFNNNLTKPLNFYLKITDISCNWSYCDSD